MKKSPETWDMHEKRRQLKNELEMKKKKISSEIETNPKEAGMHKNNMLIP